MKLIALLTALIVSSANAAEVQLPIECDELAAVRSVFEDYTPHFSGTDQTRKGADTRIVVYVNRRTSTFVLTLSNDDFMCVISHGYLEPQDVIEYRM